MQFGIYSMSEWLLIAQDKVVDECKLCHLQALTNCTRKLISNYRHCQLTVWYGWQYGMSMYGDRQVYPTPLSLCLYIVCKSTVHCIIYSKYVISMHSPPSACLCRQMHWSWNYHHFEATPGLLSHTTRTLCIHFKTHF